MQIVSLSLYVRRSSPGERMRYRSAPAVRKGQRIFSTVSYAGWRRWSGQSRGLHLSHLKSTPVRRPPETMQQRGIPHRAGMMNRLWPE